MYHASLFFFKNIKSLYVTQSLTCSTHYYQSICLFLLGVYKLPKQPNTQSNRQTNKQMQLAPIAPTLGSVCNKQSKVALAKQVSR